MTSSTRQTGLNKFLAASSLWLWRAISVIVPFITFLFLFGLIALELIPLGPGTGTLVFIVPVMAAVAVALIKIIPALPARTRRGERGFIGEIPILLSLLALFIVAAAMIIPTTIGRFSRGEDAAMALRSFKLKYDAGVDLRGLEQTLAEFERARRSLAEEWTIPPEKPPISLEILQDVQAYRQTRDESWSTGFLRCEEGAVTIVVPVESDHGALREYQHAGTPMHEMVHGAMCRILGQEAYFSVQLWFHEGMAQLYQNKPAGRIFERAANRIEVWWNRDRLPSPERFCDYQLDGSARDVRLFYQTSWEFVRALEDRYGRAVLNAIVTDVAAGATFDQSAERRLGGVCDHLYAEWRERL